MQHVRGCLAPDQDSGPSVFVTELLRLSAPLQFTALQKGVAMAQQVKLRRTTQRRPGIRFQSPEDQAAWRDKDA